MKPDPRTTFDTLSDGVLLSVADAAAITRLGASTLWRRLAADPALRTQVVRFGKATRIPVGALRQYLDAHRGLPAVPAESLAKAQAASHAARRALPTAGVAARRIAAQKAAKTAAQKPAPKSKAIK